jgi:hypothetical protein
MKKMMKNYEAPMAEMFEMQMPTVLMASRQQSGGWELPTGGNLGDYDGNH